MSEQVVNAIRDLRIALTPFGSGVESPPEVDVSVEWIEVTTFSEIETSGREYIPVVKISGRATQTLFVDKI